MDIEIIKSYVKSKHYGQQRKHGTPYYMHPFEVCEIVKNKGYGIEYQITALFHDLFEDTNATEEEIKELSNLKILEAVRLLTKEENYNMKDYIERIKNNKIAKVVKLADRLHNLSETSLASSEFRVRYIDETKKYYLDLAKGTDFEKELIEVLDELKKL